MAHITERNETFRDAENAAQTIAACSVEGKNRFGQAPLFGEPTRPVTFKETPSVIARMDERATKLGKSRSEYLRSLVAADLAGA